MKKSAWFLTILLAVSSSLHAIEASQPQYKYKVPPTLSDGWKVADFRKENIDLNKLSQGIDQILTGGIPDVHSLVILRRGKIVLDEYFNGSKADDTHALYSATKSVFSIVYGIAQDQGLLKLDQKIFDYYPDEHLKKGWDSRKGAITVGMLLSMTSGFDCDDDAVTGVGCYEAMAQSPDWVSFCLEMPLAHVPGTTWTYNGNSLTLLSNLIAQKSGMSLTQYANKYLFVPLGIQGDSWVTGPHGVNSVNFGLEWKPRDMAKLGQLYLNKGLWKGKRILSEAWVKDATTVHARPEKTKWDDYGYLWYIRNMRFKGQMVKVYWASGGEGQHIMVCPDADVVCVMTADSKDGKIYKIEDDIFENNILGCFN